MLHHRLSYPRCVSVEPFSSLLALDTSLYCVIHKMMPQYIRCVWRYYVHLQTFLGTDEIFVMCRINESRQVARIRHDLECYSQREFYVSCLPRTSP